MGDNSSNYLDPIAQVWSDPNLAHGFSLKKNVEKTSKVAVGKYKNKSRGGKENNLKTGYQNSI